MVNYEISNLKEDTNIFKIKGYKKTLPFDNIKAAMSKYGRESSREKKQENTKRKKA